MAVDTQAPASGAPLSTYDNPEAYIAGDRRRALAAGRELPDRVHGAALFADISGFTPLTEALVAELGAQRGAEELSVILDGLFNAVLVQLHRHGGSVVYFSGDAVTCWLDSDDGLLATSCALAMQQTMATAGRIQLPSGRSIQLAMKIAIAVGNARRFVVGDHLVQLIDVLAGALMDDLAGAERQAVPGEIILDQSVFGGAVDDDASVSGHFLDPGGPASPDESDSEATVEGDLRRAGGRSYLRVRRLVGPVTLPPPSGATEPLPEAVVRQWLLPAVYERLRTGRGEFLAELRTAVPLFLRFGGLDYDADPDAGAKLDRFVVAAQRIIDGYGGSTLQLTLGDKGAYLYAVFGTPLAHEDDAARACAAALELLTLEGEHAVSGFQIGLGHGRVRSGTYGHSQRRTFCCLGDAVNLAARLMTAAPPGRIFASAAVQRAAGPGLEWTRLDDQRVKGKALAVEVYELTGADRRGSTSRHRRHTLPMIGRDEQLAELSRHIVSACDGKGQVVLVSAPPGLGKSRLLVEGARVLRDRDIEAHEGEAQAFGPPTSYTVWHDIWRGALGVAESQDGAPRSADEQRDQLRRRVEELDPALLPRLPLLGAALGLAMEDNELTASLTPKLRKASLESLLISLVQRLTDGGEPLV
ncbi:MAG: adenylate/guanylate cyclase domain-containing protein, partial [Propionibacteriaceae bacterium]